MSKAQPSKETNTSTWQYFFYFTFALIGSILPDQCSLTANTYTVEIPSIAYIMTLEVVNTLLRRCVHAENLKLACTQL